MTWSERIKLAWTTFKREALPLYGWSLIFTGIGAVLVVALVIGVLAQLRQLGWDFPHAYNGYYSPRMPVPGMPDLGIPDPGMPVPGVPPIPGLSPHSGPFGSPNQNPFGSFGGAMSNFSRFLAAVSSLAGTFLLILVVCWLIGSAFYTGLFNLTAKAYRENVSFKDFKFTGFSRILGWQGFLLLIKLLLLIIGLIGAFTLSHSPGALIAFLIVYCLLIIGAVLYALPWLMTSTIYLLAHKNEGFWDALKGSWRFFQRQMEVLWGYIGAVILIELALLILSRISHGLSGIATLVVNPFIAVLAIVWVLSLGDDERSKDVESEFSPAAYSLLPDQDAQATIVTPPDSDSLTSDFSSPEPTEPKIDLHKADPLPPVPDDAPHFCPSCGKANAGTAYCPQCGTKL